MWVYILKCINSSAYVKPHLILFVNASVLYGQVEMFTKNRLSYELSIGAGAADITLPPLQIAFPFDYLFTHQDGKYIQ